MARAVGCVMVAAAAAAAALMPHLMLSHSSRNGVSVCLDMVVSEFGCAIY